MSSDAAPDIASEEPESEKTTSVHGQTTNGIGEPVHQGQVTSDPTRRHRRLARRVWVQEVAVDVTALRAMLAGIHARQPRGTAPLERSELSAASAGVEALLNNAQDAAEGRNPRYSFFTSWWQGGGIEAVFQNLHRAEAEIVKLYRQ